MAIREIVTVIAHVELLGEVIDSVNHVDLAVGVNVRGGGNLITGQVVVADKALSWLVNIKTIWELLSTKEHSKSVSTVIGEMAITDFEGVIGQVVVDDVGKIITGRKEAEDLAVIIQELLLGLNLATTEALLHEVSHLRVLVQNLGLLGDLEVVLRRH